MPWDLVLKAVAHHITPGQQWILLYVQRWLQAPLHKADGTLAARDRGTPQGPAISPLIANLFMHYAFDAWMAREHPGVRFERYWTLCRRRHKVHRVLNVLDKLPKRLQAEVRKRLRALAEAPTRQECERGREALCAWLRVEARHRRLGRRRRHENGDCGEAPRTPRPGRR